MDKLTLTDVPEGMLVDRTYSFPLRREDAPMTALQSGDAARLLTGSVVSLDHAYNLPPIR
ncbi:MAG: hypothetical protein E7423_02850 [Ruminococcaceae bacterium]|nr:hypothetical protein [Oscillospiraceae bacterium]